jgi:hypothetical protein
MSDGEDAACAVWFDTYCHKAEGAILVASEGENDPICTNNFLIFSEMSGERIATLLVNCKAAANPRVDFDMFRDAARGSEQPFTHSLRIKPRVKQDLRRRCKSAGNDEWRRVEASILSLKYRL